MKIKSLTVFIFLLLLGVPLIAVPLFADIKRETNTNRLQALQTQANKGMPDAQFKLGIAYQFGYNTNSNDGEAQRWYLKAAYKGHTGAQFNLAYLFLQQLEDEKAVYWYKQAAEDDYAPAQRALSIMYRDGRGVSRNLRKAVKWCALAARQDIIASKMVQDDIEKAQKLVQQIVSVTP